MRRPIASGPPVADDDYQGPSWWHLSRLAEVRRSPGIRRIAAIGVVVQLLAMVTGALNVSWGWNGVPVHLGRFELPVTIYPPYLLSLLSAVWLGPQWGLVPAYAANLVSALMSGLPPLSAALFALAGALEVLIFWGSMVTLNISPELTRWRDFRRFLLASVIAPVTASLAVVIWNAEKQLGLAESRRMWRGWVVGDVLLALLLAAPLLHWAGPRVRSWIDRQFASPPQYEVTYTRAALLAAGTFALLAGLVFFGLYTLEVSLDVDPATRTARGELLLPRLSELQLLLGVLVAALIVWAGVYTNVLARLGERQRRLSRRDSLSGLFNRRAFYELFPREAERARRLGHGVSLIFLDIDHFKRINDRQGHETGDRVLRQLAVRLRGLVRETDLVFRWGGEEFVVLLAHTGAAEALPMAERIRAAIAERPFPAADPRAAVRVTASVGVAGSDDWPLDPAALVARADRACYRAKEAGRDRVEIEPQAAAQLGGTR
jgi:diguanylate cyclase (GGDEF)-like protein